MEVPSSTSQTLEHKPQEIWQREYREKINKDFSFS